MKSKLFKKVISLSLVVAMLGSFGACGKKDTSATKDTPKATEAPKEVKRTKVNVLSWWDITKSASLQQLKDKFEKANPDIELEFTMVGSGYADKVLTMIAGGGDSVPDVMMLAMDKLPKFARTGNLVDLSQYATADYKKSLYPLVLDACTLDGKLYAVSRDVTSMVMFLNKKMFDDAQVPLPKDNWTVDEFLDIAKKLTKNDASGKPVQWGYYFSKFPDTMYDWILMNGGTYANKEGTKSNMSSPGTQKGLQFLYDLIYKHKVCPTDAQVKQFGDKAMSGIVAGKVAMTIGGLSATGEFDTANPKVEYAVAPLPQMNGKTYTHAFVNTWCIPKGAKNPKLAWRVLEFFSGKEGQQIALDTKMGLPGSKAVDTKAFLAENKYNKIFLDSLNYAVPFEAMEYGAEFYAQFTKELEKLWIDQTTVEKAVQSLDQKAAGILK